MAENKKSFLLYCDLIHTVKKMPKEKIGDLFLTILEYVNDQNPVVDDMIIDLVFEPIKQQLKRDLAKYESIVERNRKNGAKGGRPKNPNKPSGLSGNPKKPKKADTDTDNDNVTDKDTDIYNSDIPEEYQTLMIRTFGRNPKIPELDLIKKHVDKFGIKKTTGIYKEAVLKGFNLLLTLDNALTEDGVIKERTNGSNTTVDYKQYEDAESPTVKMMKEKSREP